MNSSALFFANKLIILQQILGAKVYKFFFGWIEKRLGNIIIENSSKNNLPREAAAVSEVDSISAEDFRNSYWKESRAIVIRGAAHEWPCCKKWSFDFFAEQYGDSKVLLVDVPGLTNKKSKDGYEILTTKELTENIKSKGSKYWRFSPILDNFPELAKDLDLSWLSKLRGEGTFGNTYYLFMGGKGRKTYLHADQPCNLYVQVVGQKRWTLFYPKDSFFLYPKVTNTAFVKSSIDIDKLNYDQYPLYKHAQAYEVVLNPGDILYVPPHVWHQVENLSDSIAVGYRYSSLSAALRSSKVFTLIRALSMNPPIWKTREYGKEDTNLIWAHANGIIDRVRKEMAQF